MGVEFEGDGWAGVSKGGGVKGPNLQSQVVKPAEVKCLSKQTDRRVGLAHLKGAGGVGWGGGGG